MKISFIGAGNVATNLSRKLESIGHDIISVHTRHPTSANDFAFQHHCTISTHLEDIPNSDIYIFAINDDELPFVIKDFGKLNKKGLCLHTAGSVSLKVFDSYTENFGVLYPLQTFTKERKIEFHEIPLFIEANNDSNLLKLEDFAKSISNNVYRLDSDSRKILHLAAVFACNFSNHCYAIASELLAKANIPEKMLIPLITETSKKLQYMTALQAQTGPAIRFDKKVMETHMSILAEDENLQEIYKVMSNNIHNYAIKNKH